MDLERLVNKARLVAQEAALIRAHMEINDLLDKQIEEVRRKLKELEESDGNS